MLKMTGNNPSKLILNFKNLLGEGWGEVMGVDN